MDEAASGVEQAIQEPVDSFMTWLSAYVADRNIVALIAAVAVIAATAACAHLLTKFIRGFMSRHENVLASTTIFVNIGRIAVWFIGLCVMLSACFKVDITALVAALGVGGIALSLGLQDTISNIIGGLQLSLLQTVKPGDYVIVGSTEGVVHDITWRHTTIQGFSGEYTVLPNSVMNSSSITVRQPARKLDVQVNIPFEALAYFEGTGMDITAYAAAMAKAVKQALAAPAPAGLGLPMAGDVVAQFRGVGEYAYFIVLIAWLEEGAEFDRRGAIDAMVRAAAPFCCVGRSGATIPAALTEALDTK